MTEEVQIERVEHAAILTLCRASKKNALGRQTVEELCAAIDSVQQDEEVRAILIAAEGDVFMAGGDLREFNAIVDHPGAAEQVIAMGKKLARIERSAVPVVAVVTGDVYGGGCEFLLLCDLVVAERGVSFSFRHAMMGLSPAWGGSVRLLERVGPLHAAQLLYSADQISAEEALAMRFVNVVVERGEAKTHALEWVNRVASHQRAVVAANKLSLFKARAVHRELFDDLEADTFKSLWGGPAHRKALSRIRK